MKNIIIAGASRAGKSTLAGKINEELNYFVINIDKLVATFGGAYPQLDIRLNWNREKTTNNIAPFLGHFLGLFSSADGHKFVLEGSYVNFEKILPVLQTYGIEELKNHFLCIGLVQNKKTVDEFVRDFKKYDTKDDWTHGFSDDDLKEIAEDVISFSRDMSEHLAKYGFTVYDTSIERERVLSQIVEDIKSML